METAAPDPARATGWKTFPPMPPSGPIRAPRAISAAIPLTRKTSGCASSATWANGSCSAMAIWARRGQGERPLYRRAGLLPGQARDRCALSRPAGSRLGDRARFPWPGPGERSAGRGRGLGRRQYRRAAKLVHDQSRQCASRRRSPRALGYRPRPGQRLSRQADADLSAPARVRHA